MLKEADEVKLLSPSKRRKLLFQVCTNLAVSQETGMQGFETGKDDSALHSSPQK